MNIIFEYEGQKQVALLIIRSQSEGRHYHVFLNDKVLTRRFQQSYLFLKSPSKGLVYLEEKRLPHEDVLIASIEKAIMETIEREIYSIDVSKRQSKLQPFCTNYIRFSRRLSTNSMSNYI